MYVHARRLKIERQKVKHEDEKLLKGKEREIKADTA